MNEITGSLAVFLGGASGVVVVEVAKFATASMGARAGQATARYRRPLYWAGFIALLTVAGFVTEVSLGSGPVRLLTALQVGINAPALVSAWATAAQKGRDSRSQQAALGFGPSARETSVHSRGLFARLLAEQAW